MPTFLFAYRQPIGYTPSGETTAAWRSWFASIGDQVVDMGRPVAERAALGNLSASDTELGGYSLINADDMEAALAIAKGCPHLDRNGGIEVGQLGPIPGEEGAGS